MAGLYSSQIKNGFQGEYKMDYRADLERVLGLRDVTYRYGLSRDELFDEAIRNDRGRVRPGGADDEQKAWPTALGKQGPLVFYSDPECTGRPVQDTFGVAWPEVESSVWWKDDFRPFDPEAFSALRERVADHLNRRRAQLYVQDVFCGWDPAYAVPHRFVGEFATHALFVSNMFVESLPGVGDADARRWTLLNVPGFRCDPERDGTRSERAVIIDLREQLILVLGPADYCGINKKAMFTVMNYLLPERGDLSMHCSANLGEQGDCAVLFGLSGTGKTTLSADPHRRLIGDDEHAWTANGVSNFEGGCYAKLIDLDKEAEPVIAAALSMPGTLIENVPPLPHKPLAETHPQELDLTDRSITENTRFSYPLSCNPNVAPGATGPHPRTIVLLTADAFGVLPPVSLLDKKDVMYHFVSGFTAKLAGTEVGVTEPRAAFSACFGAPFMARKPSVYAEILARKMEDQNATCVLLNTGWSGGPFGVGQRISIRHTRALLDAALRGDLNNVPCRTHPIFGLRVPTVCPGVPDEILDPRQTWSDPAAYDTQAERLRDLFRQNFESRGFDALGIEPVM